MLGRWFIGALLVLIGHQTVEAAAKKDDSVKIEKLGDTGLSRITLAPEAVNRLGIKTLKVALTKEDDEEENKSLKTIPYSSIIYDIQGNTWAYTNPEPNVYVREKIDVDDIEGEHAFLSKGPEVGTEVVTIGVAELYGVEKGIGK